MTIDDIRNSTAVYLTAADIAPILHCDPQRIRAQAHRDARALGFPTIRIGRRVRIPRAAFLRHMEVGHDDA